VQNGPYWYYLACHSWILDDIDICGRGRYQPVAAGPTRLALFYAVLNSYVESTNKLRRNWRENGKMGNNYVHTMVKSDSIECNLHIINGNTSLLDSNRL
jgi:hypothetical protein